MIQEIIIQNSQSLKNIHLQLAEGINTLIGDTDSGKSATFRTLEWFFKNRPTTAINALWSWSGGDIHVAVKLDDLWIGRKVILHRNKRGEIIKDDDYYYTGKDTEKNRLRAFGNGPPPEEITKILNLQDVNFQPQMALPFLLSQSAGKVGKFLNDAAGLDIIAKSESNIKSVLSKEKNQFELAKVEQKRLIEDWKNFEWVKKAESDLVKLEKLDDEIFDIKKEASELDKLLDDIDAVETEIEKIKPLLNSRKTVDGLMALLEEIKTISDEAEKLDALLNDINDTEAEIEEKKKLLLAEKTVERLRDLNAQIANLQMDINGLGELLENIVNGEHELQMEKLELEKAENKFHEMFPNKCPLCGK